MAPGTPRGGHDDRAAMKIKNARAAISNCQGNAAGGTSDLERFVKPTGKTPVPLSGIASQE
jgi:hypothetical protein